MIDVDTLCRLSQTLVPLKALPITHLKTLLAGAKVEPLYAGQTLFEQGTYDREHIYLLYGELTLHAEGAEVELVDGALQVLPLANMQPRPCRAVAVTDACILRIASEDLDRLLAWSQVSDYQQLDISYRQELDLEADWMMSVLHSNLFLKIPSTNAGDIFSNLKPVSVERGQVILRQGELGDGCYFIKEGDAEVLRSDGQGSESRWLADIGVGSCFGEDALVTEKARNATVIMLSDGILMRLEKLKFIQLLREPVVQELPYSSIGDETHTLIDVRACEEFASGHIAGAINIPLSLLRLRRLSPDKSYLLYCSTGRRANAAAFLLSKAGYNASALTQNLESLLVSGLNLTVESGGV